MEQVAAEAGASAQAPKMDTGLACLVMVARLNQVVIAAEQVRHEFATEGALSEGELLRAAKQAGLKAKAIDTTVQRLDKVPLPAIAEDANGGYFLLAKADGEKILIHDPLFQRPQVLDHQALAARWAGRLLLVGNLQATVGGASRFDFTWFIPALVKYRRLLQEVLVASFVLQLFSLVTPLFFQVVMDKVLVHHGLSTLDVIAIGLTGVMLFESALSGLRSYLFSHTASRIDVELGSRLFRHLVSLPLSYFKARRVGDSVARVRELEHIRSFLTGNAVTLVLDVLFSVVFIIVMFYYSCGMQIKFHPNPKNREKRRALSYS